MDIIVVIILFIICFVSPFVGGLAFLYNGVNVLSHFDPEFDENSKKRRAWLDIVLGTSLLLFWNASFWLALYPVIAVTYNLPNFLW